MEAAFRLALERLAPSLEALRVAFLYRSRPVPDSPSQADFLNTVAIGKARLGPEALLALAKALELGAGRRRGGRHEPRPLDLDLLVYGSARRETPELVLPHPKLGQRRFVLTPLADVAPDLEVPPLGLSVSTLLARLPAEPGVQRLAWS